MSTKRKLFDFEEAISELETIVETMENDEQTLEESLKLFERGIALTRNCQKALKEAEQKVQKLIEKEGQFALEPFLDEEEDEADD